MLARRLVQFNCLKSWRTGVGAMSFICPRPTTCGACINFLATTHAHTHTHSAWNNVTPGTPSCPSTYTHTHSVSVSVSDWHWLCTIFDYINHRLIKPQDSTALLCLCHPFPSPPHLSGSTQKLNVKKNGIENGDMRHMKFIKMAHGGSGGGTHRTTSCGDCCHKYCHAPCLAKKKPSPFVGGCLNFDYTDKYLHRVL